jgi:hypothetical protein
MATQLNHRTKVEPYVDEKMGIVSPPSKQTKPTEAHPAGEAKHGKWMQFLRGASLAVYFGLSCMAYVASFLFLTQRDGQS